MDQVYCVHRFSADGKNKHSYHVIYTFITHSLISIHTCLNTLLLLVFTLDYCEKPQLFSLFIQIICLNGYTWVFTFPIVFSLVLFQVQVSEDKI